MGKTYLNVMFHDVRNHKRAQVCLFMISHTTAENYGGPKYSKKIILII